VTANTFTRRRMLAAAATGAAAAAAVPVLGSLPADAATTSGAGYLVGHPILHLLRRATYGTTPALVAEVRAIGTDAWLNQQLAPALIDDSVCDGYVARYPNLTKSIAQVRADFPNSSWDVMFDLGRATLVRAAWSKRQLFEVMVDFWSNHLNVTCPSSEVWDNRHRYDADVIRPNALGTFADLLVASALHPAMLRYLNNDVSRKQAPNENFGRELLELHTVGVDAGYTEAEMRTSALVMTGCTVDGTTGGYLYRPAWHYTGPVSVLGWSSPNATAAGGPAVVESYLRHLAAHPSTARHIARKLATRFVSDTPSTALVQSLAAVYLSNGTAIIPVLRALFHSAEFLASVGSKVRRPYEDLIATIRTLGIAHDVTGTAGPQGLYWMADDMGQAPLAWHVVDGYPDVAEAWQSAAGLLGRWNSHIELAAHWWPQTLVLPPLRQLLPAVLPSTWVGVVDALALRLVGQKLSAADTAVVLTFVQKASATPVSSSDQWLAWKLPYLVSFLLDLPYHGLR
jgi:uncharacterized protein (DUF1800 family)